MFVEFFFRVVPMMMAYILRYILSPSAFEMLGPVVAAGGVTSCLFKSAVYVSVQSDVKTAIRAKLGITAKVKPVVAVSAIQNVLAK
jgi:hypothetical protein